MPSSKKRKVTQDGEAPQTDAQNHPSSSQTFLPKPPTQQETAATSSPPPIVRAISPSADPSTCPTSSCASSSTLTDRQARFKALQSRAQKSSQHNYKAAAAESARLATDPAALSALERKQAMASHKLLKAETELDGEDFERKRAWDWTIEESEKWDKRMEKKQRRRDDVAFQDYTQDATKVYKRQLRDFEPDKEAYERQKAELVQQAARSGGLDLVETADGELVAVDKNGGFYADGQGSDFVENKPNKEGVDRLVKDLQKAEESRLRKRRARGQEDNEEDITFINEKNKQFNQKLARFYNKYTAEIRESFERGTMI